MKFAIWSKNHTHKKKKERVEDEGWGEREEGKEEGGEGRRKIIKRHTLWCISCLYSSIIHPSWARTVYHAVLSRAELVRGETCIGAEEGASWRGWLPEEDRGPWEHRKSGMEWPACKTPLSFSRTRWGATRGAPVHVGGNHTTEMHTPPLCLHKLCPHRELFSLDDCSSQFISSFSKTSLYFLVLSIV